MKSLKELREHNNLKQREVAQHIGVSDRVYAYYEKGRTLPAKYVKPLANLFGISCDEFLENNTDTLDWEREFGCIERTERLVLPTWEEIQKYERFDFKDKYNHSYTLHYISGFKNLAISGWSTEYYAPATQENYTLACRKCKELFLGENK